MRKHNGVTEWTCYREAGDPDFGLTRAGCVQLGSSTIWLITKIEPGWRGNQARTNTSTVRQSGAASKCGALYVPS